MINNPLNVSLYRGSLPPVDPDDDGRIIQNGPIYSPPTIQLLAKEQKLRFWSNGAIEDQRKWNLTVKHVSFLVEEAIQTGRYLNSQWCIAKPSGPWAACDAYLVTVREWNEYAHKQFSTTYYLKIALGRTGQLLLSASNHPEGT